MKQELEKRIDQLKEQLITKRWDWKVKGYQQEVEERLERLQQLYDDLYRFI